MVKWSETGCQRHSDAREPRLVLAPCTVHATKDSCVRSVVQDLQTLRTVTLMMRRWMQIRSQPSMHAVSICSVSKTQPAASAHHQDESTSRQGRESIGTIAPEPNRSLSTLAWKAQIAIPASLQWSLSITASRPTFVQVGSSRSQQVRVSDRQALIFVDEDGARGPFRVFASLTRRVAPVRSVRATWQTGQPTEMNFCRL